MARVIWSSRAADDLEAICEYIECDSEKYACLVAQRIISTVERLGEFPESESIVAEFQDLELRDKIVHRYRIIYRIQKEIVEVVAMVHSSRQLTHILDS